MGGGEVETGEKSSTKKLKVKIQKMHDSCGKMNYLAVY